MSKRKVIHANDGMILTNGEVYGATIYLAEGVSAKNFHEITLAEYEAILDAENEENQM